MTKAEMLTGLIQEYRTTVKAYELTIHVLKEMIDDYYDRLQSYERMVYELQEALRSNQRDTPRVVEIKPRTDA